MLIFHKLRCLWVLATFRVGMLRIHAGLAWRGFLQDIRVIWSISETWKP